MASNIHSCKNELREVDLRATPARLATMRLLEDSDKPIDLDDVIKYLEKQEIPADPATAFRIINIFTEKGITKKIQFLERKFRYELASKKDHHHLICLDCGRVQDVEDKFMIDWEKEIKDKQGFLVRNHNVEFFGLCQLCQH